MTDENLNEELESSAAGVSEEDQQFAGNFSQEGFVDLDGYEYVDLDSEGVEYYEDESEMAFDQALVGDGEDIDDNSAEADSSEEKLPEVESKPAGAAHAKPEVAAVAPAKTTNPSRGKHAKPEPVVSESVKKSRKTRKILIGVLVVIVLALAGIGGGMFFMLNQNPATNTDDAKEQQSTEQDALKGAETTDTSKEAEKRTAVPNVMDLLGKTEQDILTALGHGATVTASLDVNDPTLPYAKSVTIELTEEYADARTGLPKVYLGLNKKGKAVQVGYSVGTSLLGYSSMNITEAMTNDHVVEQVLTTAGIATKDGSLKLPKKAADYTSYGTDGKTVVKERVAFDGKIKKSGTKYLWESVLLFDFTTSSVTGNINDTARQVYLYVTDEKAQKAADKAAKKKAKEEAKKAKAEAEKKAKEEAKKKAAEKKAAKKS